MIIDNKSKKGYLLHVFDNGRVALCRILNEYSADEKEEANDDMLNVVTNNITEEEILEKYAKKDLFNL